MSETGQLSDFFMRLISEGARGWIRPVSKYWGAAAPQNPHKVGVYACASLTINHQSSSISSSQV